MARWWSFGKQDSPADAGGATRVGSGGGSATASAVASAPPASVGDRPTGAWRTLPPVQRAVSGSTPVAPLDVFVGGLASHRNPTFLAPLGHLVDPSGPSGSADGLVRSAAVTSASAPAVQRAAMTEYRDNSPLTFATAAPARPQRTLRLSAGSPPAASTLTVPSQQRMSVQLAAMELPAPAASPDGAASRHRPAAGGRQPAR